MLAYDQALFDQGDSGLTPFSMREDTVWNYSYYPVLFESEQSLLRTIACCNEVDLYPRRYFYPDLLSGLRHSSGQCPVTSDVSRRILCLPLSHATNSRVVDAMTSAVRRAH